VHCWPATILSSHLESIQSRVASRHINHCTSGHYVLINNTLTLALTDTDQEVNSILYLCVLNAKPMEPIGSVRLSTRMLRMQGKDIPVTGHGGP
jgi:hypothetical protein